MIQIQIGQCGNQVGFNFWDKLINEHKIDANGFYTGNDQDKNKYLANSNFLFNAKKSEKKYIPRAILIDSESSVLDEIRQSHLSNLFNNSNIISENKGTGGLWPVGYHGLDHGFKQSILESIRKEAESSDKVMFQFINAIGGGTGSGLGSLLIDEIREIYPKNMINTFSVVPSPIQNGTVLDYYNSALAIKSLSQSSDGCFLFDNQALRRICRNRLNLKMININHTNNLISKTMLSLTGFQRLTNSRPINDLATINQQLVCAPKLHFFVPALNFLNDTNNFYQEIKSGVIDSLLSVKNENAKVLSVASILYGNLHQQVDLNELNSSLRWNDAKKICGSCESSDGENSVINVLNSKEVLDFFDRLIVNCDKAFKGRAFFMRYVSEGIEEGEIFEHFEEVNVIKDEYSKYINIKPNSIDTGTTSFNNIKQPISVDNHANLQSTNQPKKININIPNVRAENLIQQGQRLNVNLSRCCVIL